MPVQDSGPARGSVASFSHLPIDCAAERERYDLSVLVGLKAPELPGASTLTHLENKRIACGAQVGGRVERHVYRIIWFYPEFTCLMHYPHVGNPMKRIQPKQWLVRGRHRRC